MRDVTRRAVAGAVLLACLFGMTVHYGAAGEDRDLTMADYARLADYESAVGEPVYFWGRVEQSSEGALVVDADATTVTVPTEVDAPPGSVVQVYGEARPGRTVVPERVIVSPPGDRRYLYAVSALGLVVAAVGFLRSWRFDVGRVAFVPREETDA